MKKAVLKPRKFHNTFFAALALVVFYICFAANINAEIPSAEINLVVEEKLSVADGSLKSDASKFVFYLEAQTPNAPMPAGAADGKFSFVTTGNERYDIKIMYTQTGQYTYKVYQKIQHNQGYTYDTKVYTVKVFVKTAEDGSFTTDIVVFTESGKKSSAVSFHNFYTKPADKPAGNPDTGDNIKTGLFWLLAVFSVLIITQRVFLKNKGRF